MSDYTKAWVKCNVNDVVRFTPGPEGLAQLVFIYGRPYMDNVHPGWETPGTELKMQLWEFMQTMGPITHMGTCQDYSTNIQLEIYTENIKEAIQHA